MTGTRTGFSALGVPPDLVAVLARSGIHDPTPIQALVIADALAGRDISARAPTGSGKTLAFGVPLVDRVGNAAARRPTALVLAPTRELVDQIATQLQPMARVRGHSVIAVYGGVGYGAQRAALRSGAEIVVACPGRLEDLLTTRDIGLDDVRHVVIDEADRMADMGFLPAVSRIVGRVPTPRQIQLYSATSSPAVRALGDKIQSSPRRYDVGAAGPDVTTATHVFWTVARAQREEVAATAIAALGSTIVFCRTRHGADRLARRLDRAGTSAAAIHGGRSQPQRDRALRAFVASDVTALVATDVAARGIHVDDVAGVIHFDLPADDTTYVHRSGRTARAGAAGTVVTFVDPAATREASALQRAVGLSVPIGDVDYADLGGGAPGQRRSAPGQRRSAPAHRRGAPAHRRGAPSSAG